MRNLLCNKIESFKYFKTYNTQEPTVERGRETLRDTVDNY